MLSDGSIMQNNQVVARLGVVDVDNYDYISKYGENLYDVVMADSLWHRMRE